MRGIIAEMPYRNGGYCIAKKSGNNITAKLPAKSIILCDTTKCTLENQTDLISNGTAVKITEGYSILVDATVTIVRSTTPPAPITIVNGREVLYMDIVDTVSDWFGEIYDAFTFNNSAYISIGYRGEYYLYKINNDGNFEKASYRFPNDLAGAYRTEKLEVNGNLYLVGVKSFDEVSCVYKFDGTNFENVSIPSYVLNQTIALCASYNSKLYLFFNYYIAVYENGTWQQITSDFPSEPRNASGYISDGGYIAVNGTTMTLTWLDKSDTSNIRILQYTFNSSDNTWNYATEALSLSGWEYGTDPYMCNSVYYNGNLYVLLRSDLSDSGSLIICDLNNKIYGTVKNVGIYQEYFTHETLYVYNNNLYTFVYGSNMMALMDLDGFWSDNTYIKLVLPRVKSLRGARINGYLTSSYSELSLQPGYMVDTIDYFLMEY